MTEFVRFASAFEFRDPKTKARTRYPAGWAGELEADRVEAARKAGALPPGTDDDTPDYSTMTKVELLAEAKKRGVKVKADDSEAEIIAALLAA